MQRTSDLIIITSEGPDLADFDPADSVVKWMAIRSRKPSGGIGQTDWPMNIVSVDPKVQWTLLMNELL